MSAAAEESPSLQREWWVRALAIFQSPRSVLAALGDDSPEAEEARQEPVMAIVILAGIAGVLSTSIAGRLLDDPRVDGLSLAVWAFIGGAAYGFFVYWLGGLMVHALATGLGAGTSYRQARHLVGLAAAPLALSLLLVWPIRIAIYGGDVFRTGGSDSGFGDKVFEGLVIASYLWVVGLVVLGLLELRKRSSSSSGIS
jgi:hypothetical protein